MIRRIHDKHTFLKCLLIIVAFCVFGIAPASYAQVEVVITAEADEGMIDAGSIQQIEGFTYYEMQSSGFLEWPFEIAMDGTYNLILNTRLSSGTKGQHLSIDGKRFKNQAFPENEEFVFDANVLGMEWIDYRISPDTIYVPTDTSLAGPEILTLEAGSHMLRIEASQGFQQFSGFSLVDATSGDTAATVVALDALAAGVVPVCDASEFCPTGFKSVSLRAGAFLTFRFFFPEAGNYQLRIFYNAPNGGSSDLLLDWDTVVEDITFSPDGGDILTEKFEAEVGNRSLTMDTARGGFNVDYVQLIKASDSTSTANERSEFDERFSLAQNYPNPFNPTTTISFTLGSPTKVQLTIYDVLGREVQVLEHTNRPAGTYQRTWDGRDANGKQVATGIYFYQMETEAGIETRRMVFTPQ